MAEYPTETQLTWLSSAAAHTAVARYAWIACAMDYWNKHYGRVRRGNGYWRFATGGWSGNEDIIDAMCKNLVPWALTWEKSERGGLHVFHAPAHVKQEE